MTNNNHISQRERLAGLVDQLRSQIEAAENAFDSEPLMKTVLEWLEELRTQLEECDEILDQEDDDNSDDSLDSDDRENLVFWAEQFSNVINDEEEIDVDLDSDDEQRAVSSLLTHLIENHLEPIRTACWILYNAAIGAA